MLYGGCRKGRNICPWHQGVLSTYTKETITIANMFCALIMCQDFLFSHLPQLSQ